MGSQDRMHGGTLQVEQPEVLRCRIGTYPSSASGAPRTGLLSRRQGALPTGTGRPAGDAS